jgi:hypothetical protein
MPTRLIFVCHGQLDHEKEHGLALSKLINEEPGFRAFFAENVHDTDGLSQHIFANLERCDGFLAVMHRRGEVKFLDQSFIRASVWVQQELAIISFLNFQRPLERRTKVRLFMQQGIKREGLSDVLILNPTEFENDDDLNAEVIEWLRGPDFQAEPIVTTREGLFQKLTSDFTKDHWRFLEVMMVLSRGTTEPVDVHHVSAMMHAMGGTTAQFQDLLGRVAVAGLLLKGRLDRERGIEPVELTPGFLDLIAEELRRRGSTWAKAT